MLIAFLGLIALQAGSVPTPQAESISTISLAEAIRRGYDVSPAAVAARGQLWTFTWARRASVEQHELLKPARHLRIQLGQRLAEGTLPHAGWPAQDDEAPDPFRAHGAPSDDKRYGNAPGSDNPSAPAGVPAAIPLRVLLPRPANRREDGDALPNRKGELS